MNNINYFQKEFSYIKSDEYKNDYKVLVDLLPDYFFKVAASSTGKYHPAFSLGDGGLLRHTKVAVRIGYELLSDPCIGDKYTGREKDLMLMALTMHDGVKHGIPEEKYTRADHPLLASKLIKENRDKLAMKDEDVEFMCSVIESHMGPWNTHPYTKEEILPIPKDKYQNFVHMCDYLASRKFLDVKFENDEIID
ncbi:MAG: hypothetical protein MRZ42_05765 [Tenericutes bacterium]|nr:hypothetical protein [Mycoplasmatota bacterium]